jgi:hypothetical protein
MATSKLNPPAAGSNVPTFKYNPSTPTINPLAAMPPNQFNPLAQGQGGARPPTAQTPQLLPSGAQTQPSQIMNAPQMSSGFPPAALSPSQLMNAPQMPGGSPALNSVNPSNNGPNPSQIINAPQMPGGNPPSPLNLGNPQGGYGQTQSVPSVPSQPAPQSVEQQALGGGGNAQQVQNFMQALQGVGAGSNNTFQNAPANNPQTQTAAPLYANPSQQPSNASTNNNVQGYYNNGTGNMQQSSSNNWNAGGQVSQGQMNGNSNVNVGQQNMNNNVSTASNSASGWQPNNVQPQQSSSPSPSQLNGQQAFSGVTNNPLAQPQIGQGGSNGGYRPPGGFPQTTQVNGQQAFAGASAANNILGNMNQNNTQSQGGAFGGAQIQRPQLTPSQLGSQVNSGTAQLGSLVSDEKAKTNIMPANNLNEFLSHLTANSYTYKNKEHGEGTFVSPMAQDLEKSKLGKTMVETRPDGLKQVNYGRGFGIITAAQALMHQRLSNIEKALKIKG